MNAIKPPRKAVVPVAGLGRRLLPAGKAMPDDMVTVFDQPRIHYVVDEAFEAGIEHVIFVTGRRGSVIEDYFGAAFERETGLGSDGQSQALDRATAMRHQAGALSFVRQQEPKGLGHAIWCARHAVGDEAFAMLLPDMIMQARPGVLTHLVRVYCDLGGNVVAVNETDAPCSYGVIAPLRTRARTMQIEAMVEKPAPGTEPSNFMMAGRYILQPRIFDCLADLAPGASGAIELTDAMAALLKTSPFHGHDYVGRSFDCSAKFGVLSAALAFGLADPECGDGVANLIQTELAAASLDLGPLGALAAAPPWDFT